LRPRSASDLRPTSAPDISPSPARVSLRRSSEPVKTLSVADARRLEHKKSSVRELLNRYEDANKPLPPCIRAKVVKSQLASAMSGSLDEKRFAQETAAEPGQMSRTSTMPDVSHSEQQKDPDSEDASTTTTTSDTSVRSVRKPASSASIDIPAKSADGGDADKDDPLRRERIERYKEERRMKLREKYGLQSFKGEKEDDLVERLKQKIPK
jgi:hypothetical protein